jgi:catechol 2,3-dioxygenase-like lactoylglutathione lyase family enzyme
VSIAKINIVSVPVSDPDRSLVFYVDVLGMEVVNDSQLGPTMRWVRVAPEGAETSLTLVTWFPTMAPGSMKGLVLDTETLESDIASIKAAGVVIDGEIQEEFWGRYVTFDDPDGNGIILREADQTQPVTVSRFE